MDPAVDRVDLDEHTVRNLRGRAGRADHGVERDAEFVLFSPQDEHVPVMDHILGKLASA